STVLKGYIFFFQAEDGIRDRNVTGVQTCALPICEFRALLASVASILRQGNSLSSALQQFPLAFPPLYVSTVQASEKTSDLAPAQIGRASCRERGGNAGGEV